WAERPQVPIALVQRYVRQNLDAVQHAHEVALAQRDAHAAAIRDSLTDDAARERFDRLLDGARRETRAYEDHNYYLDCAAGALVHRALMAAARPLIALGVLGTVDDVRWLRLHEIQVALASPAQLASEAPASPAQLASEAPAGSSAA